MVTNHLLTQRTSADSSSLRSFLHPPAHLLHLQLRPSPCWGPRETSASNRRRGPVTRTAPRPSRATGGPGRRPRSGPFGEGHSSPILYGRGLGRESSDEKKVKRKRLKLVVCFFPPYDFNVLEVALCTRIGRERINPFKPGQMQLCWNSMQLDPSSEQNRGWRCTHFSPWDLEKKNPEEPVPNAFSHD